MADSITENETFSSQPLFEKRQMNLKQIVRGAIK